MVKILWCSSYSPQATMLLDNMAPTYQAATQKPQAKCKLRGLDRLVRRISKPQENCMLLLEALHNNLHKEQLLWRKKPGKYFEVYRLGI